MCSVLREECEGVGSNGVHELLIVVAVVGAERVAPVETTCEKHVAIGIGRQRIDGAQHVEGKRGSCATLAGDSERWTRASTSSWQAC